MSESNEKQEKYLGAYFDRDSVLKLSRWSDGLSWVVLWYDTACLRMLCIFDFKAFSSIPTKCFIVV